LVVREVFLGLIIGFIATIAFTAIRMAGVLTGSGMGLNTAAQISPLTTEPSTLMDQFYTMLASLFFLSLRGHHWLLLSIQQTTELMPVGTFEMDPVLIMRLIPLTAKMFVVALQIALPIMAATLLADICLALLNKGVPQINVFLLGFPLKAMLAFVTLVVGMNILTDPFVHALSEGIGAITAFFAP
jgi:flagellar biosynthesis protein FliR